jgi:hypothetical protein
MNSVVSHGQSLFDICLHKLGDVAALFDLADANGLAITDMLTPGQTLVVPESAYTRPQIAAYFANRTQRINTGDDAAPPWDPPTLARDFSPLDYSDLDYR